jgi:hypothetical protein
VVRGGELSATTIAAIVTPALSTIIPVPVATPLVALTITAVPPVTRTAISPRATAE